MKRMTIRTQMRTLLKKPTVSRTLQVCPRITITSLLTTIWATSNSKERSYSSFKPSLTDLFLRVKAPQMQLIATTTTRSSPTSSKMSWTTVKLTIKTMEWRLLLRASKSISKRV
jgi:hypothetical protein